MVHEYATYKQVRTEKPEAAIIRHIGAVPGRGYLAFDSVLDAINHPTTEMAFDADKAFRGK